MVEQWATNTDAVEEVGQGEKREKEETQNRARTMQNHDKESGYTRERRRASTLNSKNNKESRIIESNK